MASTATSSLSLSPVRWGRREAQRPAFSPYPQWGEAAGEYRNQLSLPYPSEVRQTGSIATSSLSLSLVRWGSRRAQRPAFSPYPSEVRQTASIATSSLSLSPVRWGRRRAQRPAFSPFPQWGETDGEQSDQLSLAIPSEVSQTASTATSSLSLSPLRRGRLRAERPAVSPFPQWSEADGEHRDQLSLPIPSEVRQTASKATSSFSLSRVRWGRRRTATSCLSLSPVRWGRWRA